MENQATTNTGTDRADDGATAGRAAKLGARLKTRFAGVKAQLDASQARAKEKIGQSKLGSVPDRVKGALQSAVGKVKSGLDLPSRTEVSSLAQRIEELDKKLADYENKGAAARKKKDAGEKTDWA
jgi:hypothetical protein